MNGVALGTLDELPVMRWCPEEADMVRDAMRKAMAEGEGL